MKWFNNYHEYFKGDDLKGPPYIMSDIDGVLVDITRKNLDNLARANPKLKKIIDKKNLHDTWPEHPSYELKDWFNEPDMDAWVDFREDSKFYQDILPSYLHAEFLESMNAGRLVLCTKAWMNSGSMESKIEWVNTWFPRAGLVIVPIHNAKINYVEGKSFPDGTPLNKFDCYIEDSQKELVAMASKYPYPGRKFLLVEYGHNKQCPEEYERLPRIKVN